MSRAKALPSNPWTNRVGCGYCEKRGAVKKMEMIPYNNEGKIVKSRFKALDRALIAAKDMAANIYHYQYSKTFEECLSSSRWADESVRSDFLSETKEKEYTWKEPVRAGVVYAQDKDELFGRDYEKSNPWKTEIIPQKPRTPETFREFWESHPKPDMGDPLSQLNTLMDDLEYAWQQRPTKEESLQWIKEYSGFEPPEEIEYPVVFD